MKTATINTLIKIFVWRYMFTFLKLIPRMELLGNRESMFNLYYRNCQNNFTISSQCFNKYLKNMKVSFSMRKTLVIDYISLFVFISFYNSSLLMGYRTKGIKEKVKDKNVRRLKVETLMSSVEQFDGKIKTTDFSKCWADKSW